MHTPMCEHKRNASSRSPAVIAAAAMTISVSVRYDQPIWPRGTLEWLGNLESAVTIVLGFWVGNILARLTVFSNLFQHEDRVEFEIETALAQNVPIIPVLLDGATMPTSEKLPRTIREVAYRNAAHVHSGPDFSIWTGFSPPLMEWLPMCRLGEPNGAC